MKWPMLSSLLKAKENKAPCFAWPSCLLGMLPISSTSRGQSTSWHGHLVYWVCYQFLLLVILLIHCLISSNAWLSTFLAMPKNLCKHDTWHYQKSPASILSEISSLLFFVQLLAVDARLKSLMTCDLVYSC
jgi:hypothetical protein